MLPKEYQQKKGGAWQRWNSGAVDGDLLRAKWRAAQGEGVVFVNGCMVYALKFPNGSEWSIQGGWK